MRSGSVLVFLLAACVMAASCSCAKPDYQHSYVRADQSSDGVYSFEFEMTDSLASYDFWIYSRAEKVGLENLELRVLWMSPSGESFRETVYMKEVDKRGSSELYRSGVVPAEYGNWSIHIRPMPKESSLYGLGMICKSNFDGTR